MTLQFRRGVDSDRLTITPLVGEPIYTTDTKQLYIGDGSTAGGVVISGGGGGGGGIDSAATIALIDSAYVQARQTAQDFAYSSLTGAPNVLDSADVTLIAQANDTTRDSAFVTGIIDSAYINARVTATDSAAVSAIITQDVDAAFINALTIDADTLGGQNSAYHLNYNNFTNTPTLYDSGNFTGQLTAASTSDLSEGTNLYYTTARHDSDFDARLSGGTGVTVSSGEVSIGQAVGTSDSVTFSGLTVSGDLNVTGTTTSVNSITYTIVDPLLHLADSNETSDTVDIGFIGHYSSDGGATKEHTGFFRDASNSEYYIFNGLVDSAFDSSLPTNIVDRNGTGFELATLNVGSLVGQYAGFDSDLTANVTNTFLRGIIDDSSLTIDGDGSTGGVKIEDGGITIKTGTGNVAYADFYCEVTNAHRTRVKSADHASYSGNVDVTLPTSTGTLALTSDIPTAVSSLTNDANYLDSTTVTGVIDATYVQTNQTAQDFAYSSLTGAPNVLDSADITNFIDATYIQANQTNFLDSALTTQLIDSAYVQARQAEGASTDPIFKTISVSGQSDVVADTTTDTLTLVAGSNITITTNAGTDTITFASSDSSSSTFDLEASNRANYGWHADLSTATNTGTYIFGYNGNSNFNGIFWSTDGSYLFEVDGLDDIVRRITVPTPFDISSVTSPYDTSNQLDTTSENTYSEDLWFSPDGLRLVVLGSSGVTDHEVHSYTLTSPWDLTTATYDSKTINVNSTGGAGVAGIHLSPDGRKMFIASNSTDKVHEYTLSTAYDVSTATETRTLDISSQTGGASGIRFNHQGTQMFISDGSNGVIVYQYKLTLPFNVSSASYVTSHTGSSGSGAGKGLAFSPDGAYLHTVGNGRVYEITLTGNVSYATPVVSKDVLAYDSNLQEFVDAFTLPTSDGSANQVLVTNGSGTISFADQSGGLDSALITQLIDSAYVQAREGAGGAGGGLDSAATNTLIDAKLQVLDVSDVVGADGNYGEYLKSLGNGEAEWTDLATQAKQKAFAMNIIFG